MALFAGEGSLLEFDGVATGSEARLGGARVDGGRVLKLKSTGCSTEGCERGNIAFKNRLKESTTAPKIPAVTKARIITIPIQELRLLFFSDG